MKKGRSAVDSAYALMKAAWKPPQYESLCIGQGLWSFGQWIAYCSHCKPVPLNVFEGLVGEHVNHKRWMPAFDDETVWRSIDSMPECELKQALLKYRATGLI